MAAKGLTAIPRVGLGTWQSTDTEQVKNAIKYAIEELGVRYIDTAHVYGNEAVIGEALKEIFAKGVIKREELWITTKLWLVNRRPERVEPACRDSLKRLGLDYIDLYLIHWPVAYVPQEDGNMFPKKPDGTALVEKVDIIDTWEAMQKLVDAGLCTHIGVSNFSIEMLERMEFSPKVRIQPYANQVEMSIWNQQLAMCHYCERRGIQVTAWSNFANNKFGRRGYRLLEDPELVAVAKEVGKTPGQVALQYLLSISPAVNIIPKSVTLPRIKENWEVNFTLTPAQTERIKKLNQAFRINEGLAEFNYDVLSLGV